MGLVPLYDVDGETTKRITGRWWVVDGVADVGMEDVTGLLPDGGGGRFAFIGTPANEGACVSGLVGHCGKKREKWGKSASRVQL